MTQAEFVEKWGSEDVPSEWRSEPMRLFWTLSYDPHAPRMKELAEDFLSISDLDRSGMAYDRAVWLKEREAGEGQIAFLVKRIAESFDRRIEDQKVVNRESAEDQHARMEAEDFLELEKELKKLRS